MLDSRANEPLSLLLGCCQTNSSVRVRISQTFRLTLGGEERWIANDAIIPTLQIALI